MEIQYIVSELKKLQDEICMDLEKLDGRESFKEDLWKREEGGGGRTRIIAEGDLIEKGGVNFSHVFGPLPSKIASKFGLPEGIDFHASGVSIVIHPVSPEVPIIHMNVRYFQMGEETWWFGGGIDLTPIYIETQDARSFHKRLKDTCDRFDPSYYPEFKDYCDRYFFIPHRGESRGVGGIFFDQLGHEKKGSKEHFLNFILATGRTFFPAYEEIAKRNRNKAWGPQEKRFQSLRRSRYVEFNLVYDKGTKFGLDTGGRIESILMSMPPVAAWEYDYRPEAGSREEKTMKNLRARDWLKE